MRAANKSADPVGYSWFLPGLTVLTLGAALTLLAVLLFYRMGGHSEANLPVRWNGNELQWSGGQGTVGPEGLEIQLIGSEGVVLWTSPRLMNAGVYGELVWNIAGLDDHHLLQPIWRTVDGQIRQATQMTMAAAGRVNLRAEPNWRGMVISVGLFIPGPESAPITLRQLKLRPAFLPPGEWLDRLWEEWTTREDWSQRSINFTAGTTSRPLGSLVLLAGIWIGLSGLLSVIWRAAAGHRWRPEPFVVLFLVGWLALDLRWQWELTGRLEQTAARFADKEVTERRLADLDGDLYRFLLEVRQRLPAKPVRLFIVSADPGGFWAGRTRYHLLPHNDYVGLRPPLPGAAHVGDYVLVLTMNAVRFNPDQQRLEWEGGALAVEALYTAPHGALFRVREG